MRRPYGLPFASAIAVWYNVQAEDAGVIRWAQPANQAD